MEEEEVGGLSLSDGRPPESVCCVLMLLLSKSGLQTWLPMGATVCCQRREGSKRTRANGCCLDEGGLLLLTRRDRSRRLVGQTGRERRKETVLPAAAGTLVYLLALTCRTEVSCRDLLQQSLLALSAAAGRAASD